MEANSIDSAKHIAKRCREYNVDALGQLPVNIRRQIRREAKDIALAHVFGPDHKKDKDGNPVEQGIGSPGNQSRQSIDAFRKYHDMTTPENLTAVARVEKELAVCEARRRAERAAQEKAEDDELAAE